jgi:hypothetical protein
MSHFTVILFSFWHFVKFVVCSLARKIKINFFKKILGKERKKERERRKRSLESFLKRLLLFVCFLVYWGLVVAPHPSQKLLHSWTFSLLILFVGTLKLGFGLVVFYFFLWWWWWW